MYDSCPELIEVYNCKKSAYKELFRQKQKDYEEWFDRRFTDKPGQEYNYEIESHKIK